MYRVDQNPPEIARYATLDGLRGAAALMVALFHFQILKEVDPVRGYLAVDLFFGISGFVLSAAYVERFRKGLDPQSFFALRVSRFYPLYACGFGMGLVVIMAGLRLNSLGPQEIGSGVMLGALMSPNPASDTLFPLNPVAWSLLFELVINGVLACWLWKLSSRNLACMAAAALFVLMIVTQPPNLLNMGWGWQNVFGGMARTVFSFILGMLIYRAVGHRPPRPHVAAILIPLIVLLFAVEPVGDPAIWDLAFVILIFPLVLILATTTESPSWARPAMRWLGTFSYGLYAIHWPLTFIIGSILKPLGFATAATIYLGTAILLASLLERYVDRPLQSYFKRRRQEQSLAVTASDPLTSPSAS
jgi:peptidoglycan/LPS O-acetylase OafA/YrhL